MKQTIRAFSLGLLLSTLLLSIVFLLEINEEPEQKELSTNQMITALEEQGYQVELQDNTETNDSISNDEENVINDATEETNIDESNSQPPSEEKVTKEIRYKLIIEEGMLLQDVASDLYEANIIDNRDSFTDFFTENEFSTRIQIGEFQLSNTMSIEEIADEITK